MSGQTEKQIAASMRNWGIRSLRALYAQAYQLSPSRRAAMQAIIDEELVARGAEPEGARAAARRVEWSEFASDIPF